MPEDYDEYRQQKQQEDLSERYRWATDDAISALAKLLEPEDGENG